MFKKLTMLVGLIMLLSVSANAQVTIRPPFQKTSSTTVTLRDATVTTIAGKTSLTIAAGGTNQNIVFTPSGTGIVYTLANFGIGTTDSSAGKLVISSNTAQLVLQNNNASANSSDLKLLGGASSTTYNWKISKDAITNDNLEFIPSTAAAGTTFSTPVVVITRTGNVGIGTTGPNAKFEVATSNSKPASSFWSTLIFDTTSAAAGVGGGIQFNGYKTGTSAGGLFAAIDGQKESGTVGEEKGKLSLWTNDGTQLQKRLTIDSTGNVGIGTANPSAALDIVRSTSGSNLSLTAGSASAQNLAVFKNSSTTIRGYIGLDSTGAILGFNGSANDTFLATNSDGSNGPAGAYVYLKNSTGNVGIGTTAPSSKLDVTTTALGTTQTTTSGLALVNTTAAAAGLQQISPAIRWSGFGWKTDVTAASQAVDFRAFVTPVQGTANPTGYLGFGSSINGAAYNDNQLVLTSAGNVGIGTTGPTRTLDVVGTGAISTSLALGGATIGTNALAVTGTANISGATTIGGGTVSSAGTIRMANTSSIHIRNAANTSDIILAGSNELVDGNYVEMGSNISGAFSGFKWFIDSTTPRMILTNASLTTPGNVGVGTTVIASGQRMEINGGLNLTTTTAQPACTATTRGTFWVVQSATGVKDRVEVCAKDAADAYVWRVIY